MDEGVAGKDILNKMRLQDNSNKLRVECTGVTLDGAVSGRISSR